MQNIKIFKKNNRHKKTQSKQQYKQQSKQQYKWKCKYKHHHGGAAAAADASINPVQQILSRNNNMESSQIMSLSLIYKMFFNEYFEIFLLTELHTYIINKYLLPDFYEFKFDNPQKYELFKSTLFSDEIWNLIIQDFINFFNILFVKINNIIDEIHIFSVSTGNGFLEALFAIYLKIIHSKPIVKIMYFDPYDNTKILQNYKYKIDDNEYSVFEYVIGLLQKIEYGTPKYDTTIYALRIKLLMKKKENKALYDLFIDPNFMRIDIFIAIHAQSILSHKSNSKSNILVEILHLYINLLTFSAKVQSHIPMLWLYYDISLDFTNEANLISSMKNINKRFINEIINDYNHYKKNYTYTDTYTDIHNVIHNVIHNYDDEYIQKCNDNYTNYFNLSTLDNLQNIGMDKKIEYPIWNIQENIANKN